MATIPGDIHQWTFATVAAIVESHSGELAWFDFKEVLHATHLQGKAEHTRSLQRTACAFANTAGGFIIFGVQDAKAAPTAKPRERIIGIPSSSELGKEFSEKLHAVVPPLGFDSYAISHCSSQGSVVFVARIPQSPLRPHAVRSADGALSFYRRDDGGSAVLMDYHAIRDQMNFGAAQERKLRMLRLELREFADQAPRVRNAIQPEPTLRPLGQWYQWATSERFDAATVKVLLAEVFDALPLGMPEQIHRLASRAARANRLLDQQRGVTEDQVMLYKILTAIPSTVDACEQALKVQFGDIL